MIPSKGASDGEGSASFCFFKICSNSRTRFLSCSFSRFVCSRSDLCCVASSNRDNEAPGEYPRWVCDTELRCGYTLLLLWEKVDSDPIEGRRDVSDGSRLRTVRGSVRGWLVSREGAIPVMLPVCGWVEVYELRLEFDRFRRADWERVALLKVGEARASGSLNVEVEDAVDATEAVCCRRRESSRVKRFTCRELR
jgi:hypothetical protein